MYQPGYYPEAYLPYKRDLVRDKWGNTVSINTWAKQASPDIVEPALVRVNKGLTFQKMFDSDPCPNGWKKSADSYCVREDLKHEPVFYTDKAFIPKNQYWQGYGDSHSIMGDGPPRRSSQQTDLRTVHPLTGDYAVYYPSSQWSAPRRYTPVRKDGPGPVTDQYDKSWGLPAERGYATLHTTDSYLG